MKTSVRDYKVDGIHYSNNAIVAKVDPDDLMNRIIYLHFSPQHPHWAEFVKQVKLADKKNKTFKKSSTIVDDKRSLKSTTSGTRPEAYANMVNARKGV